MGDVIGFLAMGVAVVALLVVLVVIGRRVYRRWRSTLPAQVRGIRVETDAAHVEEDQLTHLVWSIPVVLTNASRKPMPAMVLAAGAQVVSDRRTRWGMPYVYSARLELERDVVTADGVEALDPGAVLVGHVRALLPVGEHPRRVLLNTVGVDGDALDGELRGRVTRSAVPPIAESVEVTD